LKIKLPNLLDTNKLIPFNLKRINVPELERTPIAVELHWTSDCNYDCMHCSYGSRRESKGRLTDEQISDLIDDLISMKVNAVYLSGGGEPTLVKKWPDYASKLLDNGIDVSLITNGIALLNKHYEILRRMNYIAISIYSTDESEYKKITDSNKFENQWTIAKRIKSSDSRVIIGARCVINKINYKNIINIYHAAKQSGFDYLIFIPAVDYEGRGIDLSEQEKIYLQNLIKKNETLFDKDFTNIKDVFFRRVNHYSLDEYRSSREQTKIGCTAVNIRSNAFVNYCGGVWLCQPHIGNKIYSIGSLNDSRFAQIWNDERHISVNKLLNKNYQAGLCSNCRSIAFNKKVEDFSASKIEQLDIEIDPFI